MAPVDYSPPVNPNLVPDPVATVRTYAHADGRTWHRYTVRPGDSLAKLAIIHRVSIAALVKHNRITDPRRLKIGQTIQVPGPAPARSKAPATKKAQPKRTAAKRQAPARRTVSHRVAPRDNLMRLAARYDTSWRAIMKANGLSGPHHIATGSTLRFPVPTSAPRRAASQTAKAAKSRATKANTFLGRTYSDAVVARAARNRAALRHADVPSRSETRALIVRTAQRYGVNPRLALGIAWQESGWNQRAVSVANAVGSCRSCPGPASGAATSSAAS